MRILFHDDFDGAASAAILTGFLEEVVGEKHNQLLPVNFHLESDWLYPQLPFLATDERFAIVDFLYHPSAEIYFDHHSTAFKTGMYRYHFDKRKASLVQWDSTYGSCARLMYDRLHPIWASSDRLQELVAGADMVDQAQYPSVESYFDANHPAIAINLAWGRLDDADKDRLIRTLAHDTLEAGLESVRMAFIAAKLTQDDTLADYRQHVEPRGVVTITDVASEDVPFLRFAPYLYYPQSLYSISVYNSRDEKAVLVSLGKNPWIDFEHAHLGGLAQRWGGGGHAYAAGMEFRASRHLNPYLAALGVVNECATFLNDPSH